jgi:hypothetical protein
MLVNFCKDCKFYKKAWLIGSEFAKCTHPECQTNGEFLVAGKPGRYCAMARWHGPCGKEGIFWEPKGKVIWQ